LIQRLGDVLRSVPRDVLAEGMAVELAARLPELSCEALRVGEHVVGDGDRSLRARSMTTILERSS
jgi:hypothetical protein